MIEDDCPTPELLSEKIGGIIFITLLFFLTFISRYIFAPLMPVIEQDLGISHAQAGSIFLVSAMGSSIGALGAGFLSKQINHKGSLVVSILCMGIVLWSFMFLSSLTAVRIGAFLLSAAAGITLPASVAAVTAMVRREDWGKALGIHQLAPPLSLVLGPILVVIFLKWFQWTTLLAALGSIAIITSLAFAKFSQSGEFPGHSPSLPLIRSLIKVKAFWIMILFFALCMGGQVGVYAMLPLYLISEKSLDPDLANTLLGLSQVSCIGLTFVAGWLTDRLGEKKVIFISMMAAGVATLLLGWSSGRWLKLFVFLQPALIICYFPAGFSALSRCVQPQLRGLAAAIVPAGAMIIGTGLLPAVLGYMGQTYSFGLGIMGFGCVVILGSFLVSTLTLLEKIDPSC